jgi:hypothetical protein
MQTHRFHDSVALHIGDGQTVYLRTVDARKLSAAINRIARSIERESFGNSANGLTFEHTAPDGRD